jgi:hypothetical protein
MWLLQAMVFWHGMNAIKRFIDIAGKGGPELEQDQHQGVRRQIGLNTVPGEGD